MPKTASVGLLLEGRLRVCKIHDINRFLGHHVIGQNEEKRYAPLTTSSYVTAEFFVYKRVTVSVHRKT